MRRRHNPYSRIEETRRSRNEVWALILVTVILGLLLGLLTDGLSGILQAVLPAPLWNGALALSGLLALLLTLTVAWLFHGRTESQRASIDLWLPYHFPGSQKATIAKGTSYQPPRHARRAFTSRYRPNSPALAAFLETHAEAQTRGQPFQHFIAADHLALAQCLALYVLHRYGDESLGAEAPYGWWSVPLPSQRLSMDDLPAPLRDNSFLRSDQRPDEWRLLLPEHVTFHATASHWTLRHRRYGHVTVRWFPQLPVAGHHSQPYQALTTRMRLSDETRLYVVGSRIETVAHLRHTLLPASEPFHEWATGLLARLEEALDFGYYIATRPSRITRDLEWKIGWLPEGSSIVDMLQTIEARLEALEMGVAVAALEEDRDEEPGAREDDRREGFVV
ncbi:MAG: hypothetical protein SXV54_23850 [Chloroflexota bacterium]|nr:hypothetical protein [Chloroflexota bacterium]